MRHLTGNIDVAIVGGGLAGLTTAALLAESGQSVAVFERSETIGGRAITHVKDGYYLNLGAHAWYVGGPGTAVLSQLGIPLEGRSPNPSGAFALVRGELHTLPIGFVSLLTTDLLSAHAKLEAARLLARLPRMDPSQFDHQTYGDWAVDAIHDPDARDIVNMFVRVAMYANAPTLMSAGTSLAAFQGVLRQRVRYLDRGWQPIVDALHARAVSLGVQVIRSAPVVEVVHNQAVTGVRLGDGDVVLSPNVVLALTADAAARLVPHAPADITAGWEGVPAQAACLDIGLARLPRPSNTVAFGIDQPLYYSVHSATAAVAPAGGATIHVAKYLDATTISDPIRDEKELEAFLDLMQPGWRAEVVVRRYLPTMTVMSAIPLASRGGLKGRPSAEVRELPGLFVTGDWVGHEGTLANGTVASAAQAARLIVERQRRRAVA